MIQRRRENVAKYLYDLSKIVFATAVIGKLVDREHFDVLFSILGVVISWMFLEWGYALSYQSDNVRF